MIRKTTIVLFVTFLSLAMYGQKSSLKQNVNLRAKGLKHELNQAGDSLKLKAERTIFHVQMYSDNFEITIPVSDTEAIIPLYQLPVGRYVVEAQLPDRLILITLLRHEKIDFIPKDNAVAMADKKTRPNKKPITDVASATTPSKLSNSNKKKKKTSKRLKQIVKHWVNKEPVKRIRPVEPEDKRYWVEFANHSTKLTRLADQKLVDRLILRSNTEEKSELVVWEITDALQFMKHQRRNENYVHSSTSNLFKVEPYYTSRQEIKITGTN
jgi:hypothetical protein